MPEDFLVARNPDGDSTLPYLIRVPLGPAGVVLKARDSWPRTQKVYCHRVEEWPADAEVLERVPTKSCVRRGAAIDLVLDRGRENRSQLVMTYVRGGRQAIFWQTARTAKQARPAVGTPRARASGVAGLVIAVDGRERYAWSFSEQQASVEKASLPAGDYGVRDGSGRLVAVVERKSLPDLVSSVTTGKLRYQLGELASVPRAAVVVEERWSEVFRQRQVRPAVVADAIAECQVRWPTVPIVFAETRKLAQEWSYRFLAAALAHGAEDLAAATVVAGLAEGPVVPPREPTAAEIRAWAAGSGVEVGSAGRIPKTVRAAYDEAHAGGDGTDLSRDDQ